MVISTRFKINEEIYFIYKENKEVKVIKDVIKEILVNEKGTTYYLENFVDEVKEEELISIDCEYGLKDKIVELLK